MGGQPVKDVEMEFAPSHVRTRRLVRRTALRKRLVRVNAHSVNALSADSFWVAQITFESALQIPKFDANDHVKAYSRLFISLTRTYQPELQSPKR